MLRTKHRRQSSAASRAFHREQRCSGPEQSPSHNDNNIRISDSPDSVVENSQNAEPNQSLSADANVDELTSTMSALKFIPPSVRFGRGGRRGGLSRS